MTVATTGEEIQVQILLSVLRQTMQIIKPKNNNQFLQGM